MTFGQEWKQTIWIYGQVLLNKCLSVCTKRVTVDEIAFNLQPTRHMHNSAKAGRDVEVP